MIEHPILFYPNFEKEFIVQTDASLYAVGCVLSQLDDNGEERSIAYASRTLNCHKKNYTVTEKECLAVIYAYKQFKSIFMAQNSLLLRIMPLYPGYKT